MTIDAAPHPHPSAADLVAWAAHQTASFHSALAAAVTSYAATGVPPKSLTSGGGATADEGGKKTRVKKDKDAPKRAPTPYNIFVKERAAVLKEKGFDPKAEHTSECLMEMVVGSGRGRERGAREARARRPHAGRRLAGRARAQKSPDVCPSAAFSPLNWGRRRLEYARVGRRRKRGAVLQARGAAVPSPGAPGKRRPAAPEKQSRRQAKTDPRSPLSFPSSLLPALMAKVADEWKAMSTSEKDAFTSNAIARGKAVPKGSGAHSALPAHATPAAGGGDADDDERRRRKAEKRARKEAAKAAALAAGGAPAKKHKHNHE